MLILPTQEYRTACVVVGVATAVTTGVMSSTSGLPFASALMLFLNSMVSGAALCAFCASQAAAKIQAPPQ